MLHQPLENALRQAVQTVLPDADAGLIQVRPCPDPKFGDYQCAGLIALAKQRKMNPRQLATDVHARLDVTPWCDQVDIAGPGFLNFHLQPAAISRTLAAAWQGEHLFFAKTSSPRTIVVDFSSPNVAKPMHVGHIRSTILGDALARLFRLLGHRVVTDNHIGDWGTQFGMLLIGWKHHLNADALTTDPVAEMERLYKAVNAQCQADPAVLEAARQELVKLQAGDAENNRIWREMIRLSQRQFDAIYGRLGITFDQTLGESFYNARLPEVVQALTSQGIARESDGALVVFFDEIAQLKDHPAIIQKSDGGFNYATTDLATLEYRLQTWRPDEIIYVTDGRQQLHFRQVFTAFRRWHAEAHVKLAHVWFGSILGDDGKPFKTRSGDTVKLANLLDEAEQRALQTVTEKNPDLPAAQRQEIARVVGIGAIKYADLLPNRQSDYIFSWDKMLALNGNTAPYLQYAYTRVRSIFRKGNVEQTAANRDDGELCLTAADELTLAKHLLKFGLVLHAAADEYRPNYLCNYLYELAGHFARFYEACPVLKAAPTERRTRLALCDLTAQVLRQGLEVLGIEVLDQM